MKDTQCDHRGSSADDGNVVTTHGDDIIATGSQQGLDSVYLGRDILQV